VSDHQVLLHDENFSVLVVEVVDDSADDVVVIVSQVYGRLIAVVATHAICELSSVSISVTSSFPLSNDCTSYEASKLTSTTVPACVVIDAFEGSFRHSFSTKSFS
jgi:hypothetical protein